MPLPVNLPVVTTPAPAVFTPSAKPARRRFSLSKLLYRSFISLCLLGGGIGVWLIVSATALQASQAEKQWQALLGQLLQTSQHSYQVSLNSPVLKGVLTPDQGYQFVLKKNEVYAQWPDKQVTPVVTHNLDLQLTHDDQPRLGAQLTLHSPSSNQHYLKYDGIRLNGQNQTTNLTADWLAFADPVDLDLAQAGDFSRVTDSWLAHYIDPNQTILLPMLNIPNVTSRTQVLEALTTGGVYSSLECTTTASGEVDCSVTVDHQQLYNFYRQAHEILDLDFPADYSVLLGPAGETDDLLPTKITVRFKPSTNTLVSMSGSVALLGTTEMTQFSVLYNQDFADRAVGIPDQSLDIEAYRPHLSSLDEMVDLAVVGQ